MGSGFMYITNICSFQNINLQLYYFVFTGKSVFRYNSVELAEEREIKLQTFFRDLIGGNPLVRKQEFIIQSSNKYKNMCVTIQTCTFSHFHRNPFPSFAPVSRAFSLLSYLIGRVAVTDTHCVTRGACLAVWLSNRNQLQDLS